MHCCLEAGKPVSLYLNFKQLQACWSVAKESLLIVQLDLKVWKLKKEKFVF